MQKKYREAIIYGKNNFVEWVLMSPKKRWMKNDTLFVPNYP